MASKSADRREIRQVWTELRHDLEARSKVDIYYLGERQWKGQHCGKTLQVRQFYWGPTFVPHEFVLENPITLFEPRLEWFSPGYWKCRLEGLYQLLRDDAEHPGRFQARMELAWERFRCRAPKRHLYMRQLAEVHLNKKYARRRALGQEFRRMIGAMEPDTWNST
eukprot:Gregarina_sp_Pseudo_9__1662@NODE_211_length_3603_cov_39_818743_g196_i0_p3_GENE_NODE_211_length_3603_cov_39_818743_g196_i0NODE_211_length_3603_cov_39_818743_g196_i0_p3_ORF_typecomplete_len165_score14_87_NODE_211_length_3603_cov_39_818743_g196_i0429923